MSLLNGVASGLQLNEINNFKYKLTRNVDQLHEH